MNQTIITDPAAQTFEAREFLEALRMLETQGMPPGTRAYVVSMDGGKRKMQPVSSTASILDIQKELTQHLDEMPVSDEWLEQLRDYVTTRLKQRKVDARSAGQVERERIALESVWEVETIGQAVLKESRSMSAENLLIRCMALRSIELAGIAMDALTGDDEPTEDLRERLFGRAINNPMEAHQED